MQKGRKYINKDGVNKVVTPELVEEYVKNGWALGNTNANTGGGKNTKGQHYFNNGVIEKKCFECPEGFVPGRLPRSAEWNEKIGKSNSVALRGKHRSEEAKQKTSNTLRGHSTSDETRKKISEALRGKPGTATGKHWYTNGSTNVLSFDCPDGFHPGNTRSQATKDKISKSTKGKAKPHKEDSAQKRRKTNLERYGVEWPLFLGDKNGHKKDSQPNLEVKKLLESNGFSFNREVRVGTYFYDFEIGNTFIEVDPYATHNVNWNPFNNSPIDAQYHLLKTNCAFESGHRCIHLFDWDDCSKIIGILSKREIVYARNCVVKEISKETAEGFLNANHFQNYCKSKIKIGLFNGDKLISVMTFGKPRYNHNVEWELTRYCSICNVIGGVNKLFSFFLRKYNPQSIVSYCDLAKFSGRTYENLGFSLVATSQPSRHWYNPKTKVHITDNLLRQRGFDQLFGTNYGKGTSNEELMRSSGFVEIYDCGQKTFIWNKQ